MEREKQTVPTTYFEKWKNKFAKIFWKMSWNDVTICYNPTFHWKWSDFEVCKVCVQNSYVENRIPIVIVQIIGFVKYDSGLEYHFVDYVRVQLCQEDQGPWLELGATPSKSK